MNIQVNIFKKKHQLIYVLIKGIEPKNVDFPGPGTYSLTNSWEQHDFHAKKVPFNTTALRNDKRSFTHAGIHHVCK